MGLLAAASLLALIGGGATEDAEAATIVVPRDYSSIQVAVNNAQAGDTIQVLAGTYTESVLVGKTLTIEGSSSEDTVIESRSDYCMKVAADGVSISGLSLRYGTGTAALVVDEDGCEINDLKCTLSNIGIVLNGCKQSQIYNSVCNENSGLGLHILSSMNSIIENVSCWRNSCGVRLSNADNITFRMCDVYSNDGNGFDIIGASPGMMVTNISIIDTKSHGNGLEGIKGYHVEFLVLENCSVYENLDSGIRVRFFHDVKMNKCHVRLNYGVGIIFQGRLTPWEWAMVENCVIEENHKASGGGYSGIYFHMVNGACVQNSTIKDNLRGISFYSSRNGLCRNNTIVGTTPQTSFKMAGVYIGHLTSRGPIPMNITVTDTRIRYVFYGVHIAEGSQLRIENCTLTELYRGGIWKDNSDFGAYPIVDCRIRCCRISGLSGMHEGIIIEASESLCIEGCTISNSTQNGIRCFISKTSNIIANNSVRNTRTGIQVHLRDELMMDNNTIMDAEFDGISIAGTGTPTIRISNNTILRSATNLYYQYAGLKLAGMSEAILEYNHIAGNRNGIRLDGSNTKGNEFRFNTIRDCLATGLLIGGTTGANTFYLNNFINNTAHSTVPNAEDVFDDGSLGNYWDDYTTRYPNAKVVGRVWDTPYGVAETDVTDRYPLAHPYDYRDPQADAGEDQRLLAGTTASLDASGSTDDYSIASFTWSFTYDGSPVELSGEVASYRFVRIGTYDVTLQVWDNWDNTDIDMMVVEVYDDAPPMVDAGDDIIVDMGEAFTLDGSASTDNGLIVGYTWTIDPEGLNLQRGGQTAEVVLENAGDYLVVLNVTDEAGNWATDTLTVHVLDTEAPVADAGPDIVSGQGEQVEFNGSASSDNVGIVAWKWSFEVGGEPVSLGTEVSVYVFVDPGEYVVTLNVTDAAGNWATDDLLVTVRDVQPPVADAGEDSEWDTGSTVTLNGTGSTDNVGIASYVWTFDDKGTAVSLEGAVVEYTFENAGLFSVTLNVTDAAGNWDTDNVSVLVGDGIPPEADAGDDRTVDQGTEVTLDGSGSSDNVGIVTFTWTFEERGQSMTLSGPTPAYTFEHAGVFEITLEVADEAGNVGTDTMRVTVADSESPVARAGGDVTIDAGDTVVLDASGSSDNVGIVSYAWAFNYGGSHRTLEGMLVQFKFDEEGTYGVTLTVTDEAGNSGGDSLRVRVLGEELPWRLGPFADIDGEPIGGVRVEVVLNGTSHVDYTDDDGYLEVTVQRVDQISPATVIASKEGWVTLSFDMPLDGFGNPGQDVPPMEREKAEEEGSDLAVWLLIAAVALLVIAVMFFVLWSKKR